MPARIRKLTTKEAAQLAGLSVIAFRSAVHRHRVATGEDLRLPPDQWADGRTPLYEARTIKKWVGTRPGPGRWGKRPPARD